VRDGSSLAAGTGMLSLETRRFFGSYSGRACPPVPELTYPFCTRVADLGQIR
jgi:hypothetical protein